MYSTLYKSLTLYCWKCKDLLLISYYLSYDLRGCTRRDCVRYTKIYSFIYIMYDTVECSVQMQVE